MAVHLPGAGPNAEWNVHRSLELLQGLQGAAMDLIDTMDKHISLRDSKGESHPNMLGNAIAAIVLTAYAAEIALKTLHAQLKPTEKPPHGHELLDLYDQLDSATKREAQETLVGLQPLGGSDWIGENPELRALIKQGSANFTEWRYVPERENADGGVPKALVNVVHVMRTLCLRRIPALQG